MKNMSDETFFWSIKLVCIGALAILALGIAFTAHAATPVAVWDGDFSKTISGYTLNLNGNSVSDGVITINQSKGVTVNWTTAMTSGMTVLFKYSDLKLGSQKTIATSSITSGGSDDRTGVYLGTDTAGKPHGIWNTTGTYDTEATQNTMTSSQLSGTFAFTYKGGSGTYLYRIAYGSRSTVFGCAKLHSADDKNIYGCAVGGTRAGNFSAASDLKISAIAVFNSVLSEDEMKNYAFPSDGLKENAYLWLDASSGITKSGNNVTAWATRSSSGKSATSYSAGGVSKGPTVSSAALAGKDVVDFGNVGSGMDLKFDAVNNIRAVFMVTAIDDSPNAFILGGEGNYYNFHRGEQNSNVQFFSGNASANLRNGVIRRDCVAKTSTTAIGTGYGLITLIPTAGVTASRICQDRSESGRNGGKKIAELIIFTVPITDDQRNAIETYLMDKWFPKYKATVTQDTSWANLAWTPSVPPAGEDVTIINNGADGVTTVTLGNNVSVGKLTVESAAGKELKIANFATKMTATSYDFSKAPGGVGLDVSTGYAVEGENPLRRYIRDNNVKVTFYGSGEKGVSIVNGYDLNRAIQGHWVFNGGKHSMQYGNGVENATVFGANASLENPTILVKNGTTLDFKGKDLCGWSGAADMNGVIKVEDGGRINMKDDGSTVDGGTVYYRQRIALNPGAEFYVDMEANKFRLQGGTDSDKEQLYVPTGSGTAYIKPADASRDSIYLAKDETRGFGVFVGAGSTLDIQTKIACQEDSSNKNNFEIAKRGTGTLKLSGDISGYWNQGYDGYVVKFSMYAGDMELAMAQEVKCQIWFQSGTNLKLTGNGTTVSGYLDGPGKVVRNGTGSVVLSGANTYSGGTEIQSGVLALGSASALGTGTVTIGANGQLDLNGKSVTISSLAGSGTICNSSGTTAYVNGVPVKTGDELNLKDGKIRIVLGASETLALSSIPANGTVTIGGAGRVTFTTSGTEPAYPKWTWIAEGDDAWTGTYALSGYSGAANNWNPTTYYNGTKSKFEFNGTVSSGWFWQPNAKDNLFGELVLNGKITFSDGHTHPTGSEAAAIAHYCFTKLSGTGNFTISTSSGASAAIKISDVSEFAGTFSVSSSNDEGGYRIILGEGSLEAEGDNPTKAAIHLTGNVALNTLTLSASRGVKITDDVSLVFADAGSKLTVNSSVAVDSGKTIPVTIGNATGLVGTKLVTWSSQPSGDFSISVESGVEAGQAGFKATKGGDGLTVAADDTKTYYEVEGGETTTTFDNTWLTDAGVKGATTEATQANLNGTNANGIKMSDVYLMGYEAKDAQNAAVILKPDQAQSNGETISLSVAGVPDKTRNGAVVTYTAQSSADRNWENPTEKAMDTLSVSMALPTSGVLYYRVQATVALP